MPNIDQLPKPTSRDLFAASNFRERPAPNRKSPIIVSVPHTGTRFLKRRLGNITSTHTMSPWEDLMRMIKGAPHIYVPLRDPYEVWNSWCRRRRFEGTGVVAWFRSWYQLHALDMMFDLDVICVDKGEDDRIEDWNPVGHDPGYAEYKKIDVEVRTLWDLPIVARHYPGMRIRNG